MIQAALVGITGYTGMELARILASHPKIKLCVATSREQAGQKLSSVYPFLSGFEEGEIEIIAPDVAEIAKKCELAFLAVPHLAAAKIGAELLEAGLKVVDLSADFRLKDAKVYEKWYGAKHEYAHLLEQAVYGLPELNEDEIAKAKLVANPGCYPSSAILGLGAALKHDLVDTNIIIDSKSGTSGAGRSASVASLYCEVSDTFRAYNLGKHRHTPEIEQELNRFSDSDVVVSFSPHLVPMNRGILSTIYCTLKQKISQKEVHKIYKDFWANHKFIRIMNDGELPQTRNVRGTMFCDIGLVVDERVNRLIIVSVIDNLCRGASGQAVANANLMYGLPLDTGLKFAPLMP